LPSVSVEHAHGFHDGALYRPGDRAIGGSVGPAELVARRVLRLRVLPEGAVDRRGTPAVAASTEGAVSDHPDESVQKRRRAGGADELAIHRGVTGEAHAARAVQTGPSHD